MAIKIPSKHIYDIEFNPVIDNNIGYITVGAKKVNPDNRFDESVYNKQFSSTNYTVGTAQEDFKYDGRVNITPSFVEYCDAYVYIEPYYCTQSITIPKRLSNKSIIDSIKGGVDSDGNANIKYVTICDTYDGTVTGSLNPTNQGSPIINITTDYPAAPETKTVNIPKTLSKNETYTSTNGEYYNVTAQLTLNDETNLKDIGETISITEDDENFYFTCKLLCGAEVYEMSGKGKVPNYVSEVFNGTATKYIPKAVEITVYGNTLGIDLQDNTVTIGDGSAVYSFDGNELIQTTNTPSIENKYQTIIDKWKKGKASAVISCPVVDFYNDITNKPAIALAPKKVIEVECKRKGLLGGYYFEEKNSGVINEGDLVVLNNGVKFVVNQILLGDLLYTLELQSGEVTLGQTYTVTNKKMHMIFHNGDIVVPYVYTNKGDMPLAYTKDYTPMEFEVVESRISTEQGVTQEITLVEHKPYKLG